MIKTETFSAKLVRDQNRNGFRAIVQHELSKNSFFPTSPNVSESVRVREASDIELKVKLVQVLEELGMKRIDTTSIGDIYKLSMKFKQELVTLQQHDKTLIGALAYNETSVGYKFLVIVSI